MEKRQEKAAKMHSSFSSLIYAKEQRAERAALLDQQPAQAPGSTSPPS